MISQSVLGRYPQLRECPEVWVNGSVFPFSETLPIAAQKAFQLAALKHVPLVSSGAEFRRKLKEGALQVNGLRLFVERDVTAEDFIDAVLVLSCGARIRLWGA